MLFSEVMTKSVDHPLNITYGMDIAISNYFTKYDQSEDDAVGAFKPSKDEEEEDDGPEMEALSPTPVSTPSLQKKKPRTTQLTPVGKSKKPKRKP